MSLISKETAAKAATTALTPLNTNRDTVVRSMHDIGLAAWFGGSLMGAVALNGASKVVSQPTERARVANTGWDRWTPLNAVAIGAHLVGGAALLSSNRKRAVGQSGTRANTLIKLALTGAALGATGYSRVLGKKIEQAGDVPVEDALTPSAATPPEVATAQHQLKTVQWFIPGLTGALLASSALHGEQQKPSEISRGFLETAADSAKGLASTATAKLPTGKLRSA
jgi:hypothetical protein